MWRHVREVSRVSALVLALGVATVSAVSAQGPAPEALPFADLRQIKKFVSVEVLTQGTAEKLGLKSGELTDMTRVTFLKNFPGVALEGSGGPPPDGTERLNHLGFLTCEVWTVGEEYIVAYHVDCNAGSYFMPKIPGSLWNRAILGYGPKDEVSAAVHKGLRSMVEQFATSFFKIRGDVRLP
ncbi:MAG: hypothetical protein A2V62_04675 [Nitrospirae bacterium RBG_19FT_COMBO_58_9]|nr:MAG: hypothetical protein A2V62_04675 [Nitrospirae bacterium RBG_19FT_COMBO_58_9]